MAAANATVFAAQDIAYRLYFWIDSSTSGNPLTGGLTGLAAVFMQDGAPFVAATNAPVEIVTPQVAITGITPGSTTSIALASAPPWLAIGAVVTISGVTGTIAGAINGSWAVASVAGLNFTVAVNTVGDVYTSGGNVVTGSGEGYLEILASEMNYSANLVNITATNAGAITFKALVLTSGITQVQSGLATATALAAVAVSISGLATAAAVAALATTVGTLATSAALAADTTSILTAISSVIADVWDQADYGDSAGRATTVLGQIAQIWRYLFNAQVVNKNAQTQTLLRDNSAATLVQGYITVNSEQTNKGKMS